jgi:archaemetzincin
MITLIPVFKIDTGILEGLKLPISVTFNQDVVIGGNLPLPREFWAPERNQYTADKILSSLPVPRLNERNLGILDEDIFSVGLNFIFGEAEINGQRGIISVTRLRQEFYDLPGDTGLFRKRILKEAVHELGHTYHLKHCPNKTCVMHFSNSVYDADLKGPAFCPLCQKVLQSKLPAHI